MSLYLIKTSHTPEEHLKALTAEYTEPLEARDEFAFACDDGDHTGYAIYQAESKEAAKQIVPEYLRATAVILKVDRFYPDQMPA